MPVDYTDPKTLKFYTECYERDVASRVVWYLKNAEKLKAISTYGPEFKDLRVKDIDTSLMIDCLPALTQQFKVSAVNRRKKPLTDDGVAALQTKQTAFKEDLDDSRPVPDLNDFSIKQIMKPVENETKGLIHSSGRAQYLKTRREKNPEDKYYYPECSSYDYGWSLQDSDSTKAPKFGRFWAMKRDISSRSGPQPNPSHYNEPFNKYSKCDK